MLASPKFMYVLFYTDCTFSCRCNMLETDTGPLDPGKLPWLAIPMRYQSFDMQMYIGFGLFAMW